MKKLLYFSLIVLALCCFAFSGLGFSGCGNETYELTLNPAEVNLYTGETVTLEVKTDVAGEKSWSSSDLRVASVDKNGTVTAFSAGEAYITLTIRNYSVTSKVKVIEKEKEIESDAELYVSFPAVSLYENSQVILSAYVTDNGVKTSDVVTFTSSDESVVSVDGSGRITAHAVGNAEITVLAVSGGKTLTETVAVTVRQNVIISLSDVNVEIPSLTDGEPTTKTLTAEVYVGGNKVNAPVLEWNSSDETVVTADGGEIAVQSVGSAYVTVKYTADGNDYYGTSGVKVDYVNDSLSTADKYIEISSLNDLNETTVTKPLDKTLTEEILKIADDKGNSLTFSAEADSITFTAEELTKGNAIYDIYDRYTHYTLELYTADYVLTSSADYERMMQYGDKDAKYEDKSGYVVVKNDIDMTGKTYTYPSNKPSVNIVLDGGGHTVTGGTTNGFFAAISGGTYKNLILKGTKIIAGSSFDRGGAFSNSIMLGAIVDNVYVINPTFGDVYNGVGLLTGSIYSDGTTIKNCLTVYNAEEVTEKVYGIANIMGASAATGMFINNYCVSPVIERAIGEKRPAVTSGYDQNYVVVSYAALKSQAGFGIEDFKYIQETSEGAFVSDVRIDAASTALTVKQIIRGEDLIIPVSDATVEWIKIAGVSVAFTTGQNIVTVSGNKTVNLSLSESTFVSIKTSDGYIYGFVRIVDPEDGAIDRDNIGYWKDIWIL